MTSLFEAKIRCDKMQEDGAVKKAANLILVQADDSDSARDVFREGMKGTMSDYEIAGINETKYLEVFMYKASNE